MKGKNKGDWAKLQALIARAAAPFGFKPKPSVRHVFREPKRIVPMKERIHVRRARCADESLLATVGDGRFRTLEQIVSESGLSPSSVRHRTTIWIRQGRMMIVIPAPGVWLYGLSSFVG